MSVDEFNRLVALGLIPQTALRVLNGDVDEAAALAALAEGRAVEAWAAAQGSLPESLGPRWDLAPQHFHFALDGASATDERVSDLVVIEADMTEIVAKLTLRSARDLDPWHPEYRRKTARTAYRWLNGLPVTPPLVSDYKLEIHIEGGLHRFHLARHYRSERIPLLVDSARLAAMLAILPAAALVPGEPETRPDCP